MGGVHCMVYLYDQTITNPLMTGATYGGLLIIALGIGKEAIATGGCRPGGKTEFPKI